MEKEHHVKTPLESVTYEGTQKILDQMNKCVCIINNKRQGTGFFTKIPFNSQLLPVLITSNHVLGEKDIGNNSIINLSLHSDKKAKTIKINDDRKTYTNKQLDITIIEIKENKDYLNNDYIDLDDEIINYFKYNKRDKVNDLSKKYSHKSIYILHYKKGNNLVVSYGKHPEFDDSEIKHKCSTEHGSSGAPILLINNQKLIGVHCEDHKSKDYNKGTLIICSIIEFQKMSNDLIKEEKSINDNKANNYIIAEFEVKNDNETIRIINSFEEARRKNNFKDRKEYHNEEEIKKIVKFELIMK